MRTNLWNLSQNLREALGLRPLGCRAPHHPNAYCDGCAPGETFHCTACGKLQPWCKGAGDDYPDLCDDCWAIAESLHEAIHLPMNELL
ncbi:MAG TPA: hypothetical protein V6D19_11050 [Stenomitos sp.]